MKRIAWFFCLMTISALAFVGCSGGGGGGGGGGGKNYQLDTGRKLLPAKMMDRASQDKNFLEFLALQASTSAIISVGSSGDLTIGGVKFSRSDIMNAPEKTHSSGVKYHDLKTTSLTSSAPAPASILNSALSGTGLNAINYNLSTLSGFLWLGELEYATFGYWGVAADTVSGDLYRSGASQGSLSGRLANANSIWAGHIDHLAKFDNKAATFTGAAAGMGTSITSGQASYTQLLGTASLILDNAGSGTLALNFGNNLNLSGTATKTSTGSGISGSFSTISGALVDSLSNKSSSFNGDFYGAGGVPSEAAGRWGVRAYNSAGSPTTFSAEGAFGVKK